MSAAPVLRPVALADAAPLLAFESANRAYFEAHINARAPAYYGPDGVAAALALALREAEADQGHQFLLEGPAPGAGPPALLGRFNLARVRRAHFHSAEVGYRVGQAHTGRGLARLGLALLCERAFGALGLRRLEALTHADNLPSQRVLEACGFTLFGRSRRSFELHGRWLDTLHWECHAD